MSAQAVRKPLVCRLCGGQLKPDDDHVLRLHVSCAQRPEAKRLGPVPVEVNGRGGAARAFTPAEKALIRNVSAYMPLPDLLRILNERLVADLGPDAPRYTMEQLHQEIGAGPARAEASDWSTLRRVVAQARRSGVLAEITPAVIDDFAIVFRLTPAQITSLKDVIANAQEGQ